MSRPKPPRETLDGAASLALLRAELGTALDGIAPSELAALVAECDGTEESAQRAASALRTFSPRLLLERCEHAWRAHDLAAHPFAMRLAKPPSPVSVLATRCLDAILVLGRGTLALGPLCVLLDEVLSAGPLPRRAGPVNARRNVLDVIAELHDARWIHLAASDVCTVSAAIRMSRIIDARARRQVLPIAVRLTHEARILWHQRGEQSAAETLALYAELHFARLRGREKKGSLEGGKALDATVQALAITVEVGAASFTAFERAVAARADLPSVSLALARLHRLAGRSQQAVRLLEGLRAVRLSDDGALWYAHENAQQAATAGRFTVACGEQLRLRRAFQKLGWTHTALQCDLARAAAEWTSGDSERALATYQECFLLAESLGAQRSAAISLSNQATRYALGGEGERAMNVAHDAATRFRAIGDWDLEGVALNAATIVAYDRGHLALCAASSARAVEALSGGRRPEHHAYAIHNRIEFLIGERDVARARALLAQAESTASLTRDGLLPANLEILRGRLAELQRHWGPAIAAFTRAETIARRASSRALQVQANAYLARASARAGKQEVALAGSAGDLRVDRFVGVVSAHIRFLVGGIAPWSSSEVRAALLGAWDDTASAQATSAPSVLDCALVREAANELWLDMDAMSQSELECSARCAPGIAAIEPKLGVVFRVGRPPLPLFRTRRNAFKLLSALAQKKELGAVSGEELVAAIWEGERILPRAAKTRLHAAVSQLRGLGVSVEFGDEGYTLRHPEFVVLGTAAPVWTRIRASAHA